MESQGIRYRTWIAHIKLALLRVILERIIFSCLSIQPNPFPVYLLFYQPGHSGMRPWSQTHSRRSYARSARHRSHSLIAKSFEQCLTGRTQYRRESGLPTNCLRRRTLYQRCCWQLPKASLSDHKASMQDSRRTSRATTHSKPLSSDRQPWPRECFHTKK